MGGNNSNRNRFPLPENWTVEDFICAVVPIPNDPEYIATFRGLLDTLTWQRSFVLHQTENAAYLVSKTWQAAFASVPITFQNCEAPMLLRQNPDDPCQLEQSQDGGDTWSLAFDYSLCQNVITVPAPYPGSETGASDAAAASIRNIFEALTGLVDCEATKEEYISTATAYLRTFDAAYANPIALGAIYDAFCALDEGQQDFYKSDCPYTDHKNDLENCADPSGLYDWLNCASEAVNDWLNDTSDALMNALNQAAAALSGNAFQLASQGGAGGGGGFGEVCEQSYLWEFEGSDLDFALEHCSVNTDQAHSPTHAANAPVGAWSNGVNYSHGCWFIVECLTDGVLKGVTFWQKTFTTPGYTGCNVVLLNSDDSIDQASINTDTADLTWRQVVINGLDWSVTAGQKIRVELANSDNDPATLQYNDHHLDDIEITVNGVTFP